MVTSEATGATGIEFRKQYGLHVLRVLDYYVEIVSSLDVKYIWTKDFIVTMQ